MASPVEEGEPIAELPRLVSGSVVSVAEKDGTGRPHFTFEMNLGWSDGTESIIFRGYQEFFDFHCQLLDSFPEDAGNIKGSERVIPFLPGKQVFRRSTRNLALQRLPKLHEYLQEILKLPDHILSSVVLLAFMRDDWEEEKMHYFPPPKNETSTSQLVSFIDDSEGGTPDDLMKSMEAVKMDDGVTVRYQRQGTPMSDSGDEVTHEKEEEFEPMLATTSTRRPSSGGSGKGRERKGSQSGGEEHKGERRESKKWKRDSKKRKNGKEYNEIRGSEGQDEASRDKNLMEDSQEELIK